MSQQGKDFFEEDSVHFVDYLKYIKPKWYVFAISIMLCVLFAYIYIGKSPKAYERNAQIMFSEDNKQNIGRLSEITSPESTLELSIKKDANNEKELFASKKLMLGVVKALKLDIVYLQEQGKTDHKAPIEVLFSGDTHGFSFQVTPVSMQKVEISNFNAENEKIIAPFNEITQTPFGKIKIVPTIYLNEKVINKPVTVSKKDPYIVTEHFAKKLNVATVTNSTLIKLSIRDNSVERAERILNALIDQYEKEYIADKKKIYTAIANQIDNRLFALKEEISKNNTANNPTLQTKKDLYLYLLKKKENNELASKNIIPNYIVIDMPFGSSLPASPKKGRILFFAMFMGVCIPGIYFLIKQTFNTKITDISCLKSKLSFPLVACIPYIRKKRKATLRNTIVVKKNHSTPVGEAFRIARNNIDIMLKKENKCHTVLFTSCEKASGKSFTALNTAVGFGLSNRKTLFIDCDLHGRHISNLFESAELGISDYLMDDNIVVDDIISKNSACPEVDFIFAGKSISNPSDWLTIEKLSKLIANLTDKYDYIFIDTVSIDSAAEVSVVAEVSELIMFVICENLTRKNILSEIDYLQSSNKYTNIAILYNKSSNS